MVRWRRARGIPLAREDVAENIRVAVPIIDVPDYVEAAETATRERNAGFMTVMLEGRYTDEYLAEAGGDSPKFTDDELQRLSHDSSVSRGRVCVVDGWIVLWGSTFWTVILTRASCCRRICGSG